MKFEEMKKEMKVEYDSTEDTKKHIARVGDFIDKIQEELEKRKELHDKSKLENPEKEVFDKVTGKLKGLTYGSDEYKAQLKSMKPALDHHYENNSHHPEHHEAGIKGMDIVDILEMISDWKAATERHDDGDIMKSLELNQKRFGYSDDLKEILINTVNNLFGEKENA